MRTYGLGVLHLDRNEARAAAASRSKYGDKTVRCADGGLAERRGCILPGSDR